MDYEKLKREIMEWLKEALERVRDDVITEVCRNLNVELDEEHARMWMVLEETGFVKN